MTVVPLPKPAPETVFVSILPDDVSAIWDGLRQGLEAVRHYADHWRPEDVYMALRQGQAYLHIAYVDGRYAGFTVSLPSRAHDGPVLHVWAVYAVPGLPRLRAECMAHLRRLADEMKARRITFTSPRKGWERVGKRYGFEPTLTIFECEVSP